MKKIGIITINDFNNYGNRLQCYALQRFLEELGYFPENIYNTFSGDNRIVRSGRQIYRFLRSRKLTGTAAARAENFAKFNENIRFSEDRIINGQYREGLNERYDFFITGSDQVWNPMDSGRSEVDFLTFASDEKRISFSASMGVETLCDNTAEKYRGYLNGFQAISVREQSARRIVENLTGRNDVEVLIDPTMLLPAQAWEHIAENPHISYGSKYILTYLLGGGREQKHAVRRIAEQYHCEIVDVYDINSPFYQCGPQHFLYLVKNAFLICTDSFHCSVFAFLFDKPFLVFNREHTKMDMNSRLDTFLNRFGLQNSRFSEGKDPNSYLSRDYAEGYRILEQEREKARAFIRKALANSQIS